MSRIGTVALLGLVLASSACAVYAPYPGYGGYPDTYGYGGYGYAAPPVVVGPPVIGLYGGGGYWHHRHWR